MPVNNEAAWAVLAIKDNSQSFLSAIAVNRDEIPKIIIFKFNKGDNINKYFCIITSVLINNIKEDNKVY
jgi:hypothetical protein